MSRTTILLVIVLLLAGCLGGSTSAASPSQTARLQAEALVAGDVDTYASFLLDDWWDFGGCVKHAKSEMLANARGEPSTANAGDVYDINHIQVKRGLDVPFYTRCGAAGVRDGDQAIYIPLKPGQPGDGFSGLYRVVGGRWMMIGGD